MRFGRVDTLGQYISEFDPEPDSGKKGLGIHCSLTYCRKTHQLILLGDHTNIMLMLQYCVHLSSVTLCIVAKRCILEQKLLLTAHRKWHYKKSFSTKMTFV